MDMRRVTDLLRNKDILMPGPVQIKDELRIQSRKEEHVDIVKDYMFRHCERKGVILGANVLTTSEAIGYEQIQEGIMNKG